MSQHSNPDTSAGPRTPLVFTPVPLATGNTLMDDDGGAHQIAGVRVLVSTEGSSHVSEVNLQFRLGGWWTP